MQETTMLKTIPEGFVQSFATQDKEKNTDNLLTMTNTH